MEKLRGLAIATTPGPVVAKYMLPGKIQGINGE
jgi:hypothetical protein